MPELAVGQGLRPKDKASVRTMLLGLGHHPEIEKGTGVMARAMKRVSSSRTDRAKNGIGTVRR